jgi:hypothetical protein
MDRLLMSGRIVPLVLLGLLLTGAAGGCQQVQRVSVARLVDHQAMIDFSGLADVATFEPVKAQAAAPRSWKPLDVKRTSLFTDVQWKSPSGVSGVGVTYIKLPLPLGARTILWFAKNEYAKKHGGDGRLVDSWTDDLGRLWFVAENDKYRARGFIVARGWEAWVVYCGYKTERPPDATELSLAARCLETIVPLPGDAMETSTAPVGELPTKGSRTN